jgi:CRISPR-associated protein Csb2
VTHLPTPAGKDLAGHFLPTAEGDDRRRITHVTVHARRGFDPGETAALSGLRRLHVGDLDLRAQLVGLGQPTDFRADLFGGPAGAACVWESATPYVGPAHIGRFGRTRYLRKAIRAEWRRCRPTAADIEVEVVALADDDPAWRDRPRPSEFRRGRSRAGDDGHRRPFGTFRLTFTAPIRGPLCLGFACHYGLGLFLPRPGEEAR